ncbi:MAG: choice-of-anchor X domain-containing protein [Ottowia sp.]
MDAYMRSWVLFWMLLFLTGCFSGNFPGDVPFDKNISLDLDAEEVIFRNLPTKFASSKTYKLMLQKGVSTKISAFLPGAPGARLELESPSGKKISLANQKSTDFLVQETINPTENGMWKLNISGPHAEYDSVIVTRPRSHVAIDAGVTKSALTQGEATTIYAYLYDRRRAADTEFEKLPQTVNVGAQTMQATLLDGSGKLQTVVLRDDGTGGDAVANDGFFMAHYRPTADGTVFMTVTSVRDSDIQITNDRPVRIDVTAASESKIQSLSTPKHSVDRYGAHENIFFTVNAQLREAGKYYVTATIKSRAGKHLNSIKSAPVAAIAGGQHTFLLELDRDFILDNKDEMPFSIDTVFLTVATRRKEILMDHKTFNTVVPYTDPSLFNKRKITFKGVQ